MNLLPPNDSDSEDDGRNPLQIGDESITSHYVESIEEKPEQEKGNGQKQESSKIRERVDGSEMKRILGILSPPKIPKTDEQSLSPRDEKFHQPLETPGLSDPCYSLNINDTSDTESSDDQILKNKNPKDMEKSFKKDENKLEVFQEIEIAGERRRLNFDAESSSSSISQVDSRNRCEPLSQPFETNIQPDGSGSHSSVSSTIILPYENTHSHLAIHPTREETYRYASTIERNLKNRPESTFKIEARKPYKHPHPLSSIELSCSEYPHLSLPENSPQKTLDNVPQQSYKYPHPSSSMEQPWSEYPFPTSSIEPSWSDDPHATSSIEQPWPEYPLPTSSIEYLHPTSSIEQTWSEYPHPTSSIEQPLSEYPHPTSSIEQPLSEYPHPTSSRDRPSSEYPHPPLLENSPQKPLDNVPQQPHEYPHPSSSLEQPWSDSPHPPSSVVEPPNPYLSYRPSVVHPNLNYPNPTLGDVKHPDHNPYHQSSKIRPSSDTHCPPASENPMPSERNYLPSSSFRSYNESLYSIVAGPEISTDSTHIQSYSEAENFLTAQDQDSQSSSAHLQKRAVSVTRRLGMLDRHPHTTSQRNVQSCDINPHQFPEQHGEIDMNAGSGRSSIEGNHAAHVLNCDVLSIVIDQVPLSSLIARAREFFKQQSSSSVQSSIAKTEFYSNRGPEYALDLSFFRENKAAKGERLEVTGMERRPNTSDFENTAQVSSPVKRENLQPITEKCSFDNTRSDVLATLIYNDQSRTSVRFDTIPDPIKYLVYEYLRKYMQKRGLNLMRNNRTKREKLIEPLPVIDQAGPSNVKTQCEMEEIKGLHSQDYCSPPCEYYIEKGLQIIIHRLIADERCSFGYNYFEPEINQVRGVGVNRISFTTSLDMSIYRQPTEMPTEKLFVYFCVNCLGYFSGLEIKIHPCFQQCIHRYQMNNPT